MSDAWKRIKVKFPWGTLPISCRSGDVTTLSLTSKKERKTIPYLRQHGNKSTLLSFESALSAFSYHADIISQISKKQLFFSRFSWVKTDHNLFIKDMVNVKLVDLLKTMYVYSILDMKA